MDEIKIGETYKALLNGEIREFTVIEPDTRDCYWIRWDDGDEEWAYIADIIRMIEAAQMKIIEEKEHRHATQN